MKVVEKAIQGSFHIACSTYFSVLIGCLNSIILARVLMPKDFGVIALAVFFLSFLGILRQWSLNEALIHRQKSLEEAIPTNFILEVSLAILTFGIILVASPVLTKFYDPIVVKVLIIFGLCCIIESLGATQKTLLQKEMRFKQVAFVNILGSFVAFVTSVVMALKGFGVWSLVAQRAVATMSTTVTVWIIRPWKFRWVFDKDIAKWFFKFCSYLWLTGVTLIIAYQFDDFLIGSILGLTVLGFYTKAYNLSKLPTNIFSHVLETVTFPAFAKLQDSKEELSETYDIMMSSIVRVGFPVILWLAFSIPELVKLIITEKWIGIVPIFRVLIFYSFLRLILDNSGGFFTAIGKPKIPFKASVVMAVFFLITALPACLLFKAVGVAVAVDLSIFFGVIISYYYILKYIDINLKEIFLPSIVAGLISFAICFVLTSLFPVNNLGVSIIIKFMYVFLPYVLIVILIEKERFFSRVRFIYNAFRQKEV